MAELMAKGMLRQPSSASPKTDDSRRLQPHQNAGGR